MSDIIPQSVPLCVIDGCKKPIAYKRTGLCRPHYRVQRAEKINQQCSTPGCSRKVSNVKRGLCFACYQYWRKTQNPESPHCKVPGCDLPLSAKGYCQPHYLQVNKFGEVRPRKTQKRPRFRKPHEERITSAGYKIIYVQNRGYLLEHRHTMEQKLGRHLLPGENVHHIDGNKLNNNPDNLELWITRQPQGQRVEDLVSWAKEILKLYGE